jgi:hypothetical protein
MDFFIDLGWGNLYYNDYNAKRIPGVPPHPRSKGFISGSHT